MPLARGHCSVFVYFRVGADDLDTVRRVVEAFQDAVERQGTAAPLALMRRPGEADGDVTLMEVYRIGATITPAARAKALEGLQSGPVELAPLLHGARHVEVFELLLPGR